jgi:transcriptional regulator with XRE-family HTH domain
MEAEIGQMIRELRNRRGLTLKELSAKTSLSVGYLSQTERGITSIGITSLKAISEALAVDLSHFFVPPKTHVSGILRSYERELFRIDRTNYIYFSLANSVEDRQLDPMLVEILPGQMREEVVPYPHAGEEFVYVLEGVLTVFIGDKEYTAYPGDSLHISSTIPHNCGNFGTHVVRLLTVNTPRFLGQRACATVSEE